MISIIMGEKAMKTRRMSRRRLHFPSVGPWWRRALSRVADFRFLGWDVGIRFMEKAAGYRRGGRLDFDMRSTARDLVNKGRSSIDSAGKIVHRSTKTCLLYTSPSPRDGLLSRMPSS